MPMPRILIPAFGAAAVLLLMAFGYDGTVANAQFTPKPGTTMVANPITGEGLPNPAPNVTKNWGELPAGRKWGTSAGLDIDPKYKYRAPKEGIITWVDGIAIPSGAENLDQAYEFINFILSPENGGAFSNATGYNSCVAGAENHLDEDKKRIFKEVYPPAVMQNLWWWPADAPWLPPIRQEYVEKITNT